MCPARERLMWVLYVRDRNCLGNAQISSVCVDSSFVLLGRRSFGTVRAHQNEGKKRVSKYSMVSRSAVACTVLVGAVLSACSDSNSSTGDVAGATGGAGGFAGASAINGKDGV